MKTTLLVILVVVVIGGSFAGYWFIIRNKSSITPNTNTTAQNANTTNQTTNNNNNSGSISMPLPLTSWNQNYEPISTELQTRPASVATGLTTCDTDNFCLNELAIGFRDARVCERLDLTPNPKALSLTTPIEDLRDCFKHFGRQYGAYDCSVHQNQPVRDMCYWVFSSEVFVENPIDGCSKIVNAESRSDCRSLKQEGVNLNTSMTDLLLSTKSFSLSQCYVNQHPSILSQMPQNEVTSALYAEASKPNFVGCDDFTQTEIDGAKQALLIDADQDGVVLSIEEFYKSSDTLADTDNDGYTDLEELIGGYNPSGPGKL
jgi:hypothetical protein